MLLHLGLHSKTYDKLKALCSTVPIELVLSKITNETIITIIFFLAADSGLTRQPLGLRATHQPLGVGGWGGIKLPPLLLRRYRRNAKR